MKPTKNRIYCNDCHRVKMLFESEAKALNFMHFNVDKIAAENKNVPVRAYFCAACGGWHITKHDNAEWFKEKEDSRNGILSYQSELKIIVKDFFTNYSNKQELAPWKLKMDKALELYDKLQKLNVHNEVMLKAEKCFKQFQINLARQEKKAMEKAAEVYLVPVRELVVKLESDVAKGNLDDARQVAGEVRVHLDAMQQEGVWSDDAGRFRVLTDMLFNEQQYTLLESFTNNAKAAQQKLQTSKVPLTAEELEMLDKSLEALSNADIKKSILKSFKWHVHTLKSLSDELERKINQVKKYEDAQCIKQIRSLLGEVIAAMESGNRQAAEDKLDVAYIYLGRMSHTPAWTELSGMADKLKDMLS